MKNAINKIISLISVGYLGYLAIFVENITNNQLFTSLLCKISDFCDEEDEFIDISVDEFYDGCDSSCCEELVNLLNEDDYITMDVEDFYYKCDDIDKLIKLLIKDRYIDSDDEGVELTTLNYDYFIAVHRLKYIRPFMSIEDEQKIIQISKKY